MYPRDILKKQNAMINFNGKMYSGRSIVITNGRVNIDGRDVTEEAKHINIVIDGSIDSLTVDYCNTVTVKEVAKNVKTQSGDVVVNGNIGGDVKTMSGSVECEGSIAGDVSTMSGSIRSRK
jgi:hypothetical protein